MSPEDGDGFPSLILRDAAIILPMQTNKESRKAVTYLCVLAIQIAGAVLFVWQHLPEFRQIALDPGRQLPYNTFSDLMTVGVLLVMQVSFWCRLLYIPIPFRRPSVVLNHLLLFLGRLSFIFGSALFAIVAFRHLPELGQETDILLAARRGIILVGSLFALFCTSLEVERLGQAFERHPAKCPMRAALEAGSRGAGIDGALGRACQVCALCKDATIRRSSVSA